MTIKITKVAIAPGDQPVAISFEGDQGKPFKACKSMRRVLVHIWGADASQYVGRSMTLYRDPEVKFGSLTVGGIRISHMSHMTSKVTMALTATKGAKRAYEVKPLKVEQTAPKQEAPAITLKLLDPEGRELTAKNIATWVGWSELAIGKIESATAMAKWRADMAPHFLAAEHVDVRAVEHVQGKAQDRLDELADQQEPAA